MSLAREIQQRLTRDLGEHHRENVTEGARLMQQINGAAQRLLFEDPRSERPHRRNHLASVA